MKKIQNTTVSAVVLRILLGFTWSSMRMVTIS